MIKRQTPSKGMRSMVAAMIPGATMDPKGRVALNISTSNEIFVFNIGGTRFETYRSTLHRQPNSPLADRNFLNAHYRADKGDYFFDRDPSIFQAILNYLRTGELHIPSYICGPAAKTELEFWGMDAENIERCCWTNYKEWNSTLEALDQLERYREVSNSQDPAAERDRSHSSTARKMFKKVSQFLHAPDTSVPARFISFVSLLFVITSTITFVAETTEGFEYFRNYTIFQGSQPKDVEEYDANNINRIISNLTSSKEAEYLLHSASQVVIKAIHPTLKMIDRVCLAYFAIEYILKVCLAPNRLKYVISGLAIIDLLAVLPDLVEILVFSIFPELRTDHVAVNILHALRVIRVLRIFRLIQHVPGLWILVYTLKASIGELVLLACFMSIGILVFSSLIYFVEDREHFKSIPDAFWWALITMTTVGYGDMYPVTALGKVIGSLCALSGLLMLGFSVPMLVNNFTLYYKHVMFALKSEKETHARTKKRKSDNGTTSCPTNQTSYTSCDSTKKDHNSDVPFENEPLVDGKD